MRSGQLQVIQRAATESRWSELERSRLRTDMLSCVVIAPLLDASGAPQGVLVCTSTSSPSSSDAVAMTFLANYVGTYITLIRSSLLTSRVDTAKYKHLEVQ